MSDNPLQALLEVLQRLRGEDGCPWDRSQTLASAARYLSDEVVEYVDAAARDDLPEAREELADLLYMVCFNWMLLNERSPVSIEELARAGAEKLIRRKPHVFGDEHASTPEEAQRIWRREKQREKARQAAEASGAGETGGDEGEASALKDLSPSACALRQAYVYGATAAETGFDWKDHHQVLAKLHEEIAEFEEAFAGGRRERIEDEVGDILFAAVQLARKCQLDPELALQGTNAKFARRFRQMEARCRREGRRVEDLDIETMFAYWEHTKLGED